MPAGAAQRIDIQIGAIVDQLVAVINEPGLCAPFFEAIEDLCDFIMDHHAGNQLFIGSGKVLIQPQKFIEILPAQKRFKIAAVNGSFR